MAMFGLVIAAAVFSWIIALVHRWRNPKCKTGNLPPGSMGLPLLGETHHFFFPTDSLDVPPFVKERMKRYGPLFKTSLVGRPVVVSTDPNFNHFVFQQEGKLFQSWYPETFTEIFGRQNVGSLHGLMYKNLKNMVLNLFGPESLKDKLLPCVEETSIMSLNCWSTQESVELKEAIATMIFNLTAKKLISYDASNICNDLRSNFTAFMQGLISFPIELPGTAYYKCMEGRRKAMKMLKKLLEERKSCQHKRNEDFLDNVVDELGKEKTMLTEAIALDLVFVLIFASYETTSLATTMAIKFLTDHPLALQKLTEEHDAILRGRENPKSGITWKEYKSMTFTSQVIYETVRLANIVPGIFRKTLIDIHTKDFTIPKGWAVMVCPPAVHLNPDTYENPLVFNPWRWQNIELHGASKNFMAFGGGMRFCVGAEYTKLQISVFLHCLITNYRWIPIRGGNIKRTPGLAFPDGFHVQLLRKNP